MTAAPKLSVLIPVYNEQYFVEQLVDKVLAALHNLDITCELIIVNDCSNDGTPAILQRLADFVLVTVDMGTVDVPVAHLDGRLHGLVDLTGLGFPGTQAQLWHGIAVGKCQCFHHLLLVVAVWVPVAFGAR